MLEISEIQEIEESQEQEDQCGLYYTIEALYYGCSQTHIEPHICLNLTKIGFSEENNSHLFYLDKKCVHHGDDVFLCLNAKTFAKLTKYYWNGTVAGLEPLKKLLVGRKFKLELGIK